MKANNPITGEEINLPEGTQLNEIITADDGTMFEVVKIDNDSKTANLEKIEVEEDWGE